MKKIVVYTMENCGYCEAAKRLLRHKKLDFEERLVPLDDEAEWDRLERETGFKTMPQIFVGDRFIGGYSELSGLDRSGDLARLLGD